MIKSVPIICMLLASTIARAGDSLPFMLDTRDVTILSKAELAYNSSWIGGDSSATVVIYDNGSEVYRGSGVGDYEWISAADGRHTLTYTTYIDGVAQDEVYEAIVYSGYKYELVDGKVVLQGMEYQDGVLNIPSEIDGYPVAEIAAEAFAGCSELTSVTIPGSVERIGRNAFEGCIGLKNVTMPFEMLHQLKIEKNNWILGVDDVYQSNDIGDNKSTSMTLEMEGPCDFSFEWKVSSERNYDKLKWYLDGTRKNEISGEGNGWQTVDCSIPEGNHTVTWEYSKDGSVSSGDDCGWVKIGDTGKYSLATLFPDSYASMTNICLLGPGDSIFKNVFADCSEIERIVIPSSVTNIDVSAFQGCTSLKYLEVDDGNPEFTMIDGLLCNKDITRVLFAVPAISTVIIPNIVTNIATNAFLGCVSLRYVELPYSLKSQVEKEDLFASCLDDMEIVYVRTTADPLDGEWHEGSEGVGDGVSLKFTANDSSSVWIETVVTNAGRVSFDWKISSEKFKNYKIDYFSFLIDGQEIVWDNGEVDWTNLVYEITGEGEHVLRWVYTKDESGKSGQDCAWLKDFSFTPLVTVAFSMGDADEGRLPESVTGYSGDTLVIPEDCVLRKEKHTFAGWTDGVQNYAPGAAYTLPRTDITLLPVLVAKIVEAPVIEVAGRYYTQKTTASISCQTEGARIYYTLDGTEPTAESNLYEGPFEVEGSAVIRAFACKDDWFSSEVTQALTERAPWTGGECLNSAHLPFLTDDAAGWVRDLEVSHDGQASMRSGTIGDSQESSICLTVNGPGEISFWWKVSSESYKNYQVDYLSFTVDGVERSWICGEADWEKVSFVIEGDGAHEIKWTYKKDAENSEGSDAAWLDEVVWQSDSEEWPLPDPDTVVTLGDWYEALADDYGVSCARWESFWMGANVAIPVMGLPVEIPASMVVVTAGTYSEFGTPYVLSESEMWNTYGAPVKRQVDLGNVVYEEEDGVWANWETEDYFAYELSDEIWPDWAQIPGRQWIVIPTGVPREGTHTFGVRIKGIEHAEYTVSFECGEDQRPLPYEYKVTFDANGGAVSQGEIIVRKGEKVGSLPVPTRSGWDFAGWFTASEGGTQVTADTVVTGDMTLFARWEVNNQEGGGGINVPVVSNVRAKQRFPWNGKVDISFVVIGDMTAGLSECDVPVLSVYASNCVDGVTYRADRLFLSGDIGSEQGLHKVVWDMNAQGIGIQSDDVVFSVMYSSNASARYCVVDLSPGKSASKYPVTYYSDMPSGGWTDDFKTTKLVLRRIDPGTFKMNGSYDVMLTKAFYCGVFEVTQKQYELVTGSNPSNWSGDTLPVENVSWNMIRGDSSTHNWPTVKTVDSNSFVGRLQARTGLNFDLPTEVQWEYACRAGTTTAYYWGDSMYGAYAWYSGNSSYKTHIVGTRTPNAWGLYDMSGNVWEWCLDWSEERPSYTVDFKGPESGTKRVFRGGGCRNSASWVRSIVRSCLEPYGTYNDLGEGDHLGVRLIITLLGGTTEFPDIFSDSNVPIKINSQINPMSDSIGILYDASWVGGDTNAIVVVRDNGTEIKRTTGVGEFVWSPTTAGKHTLTYTTYINGVVQDEVYTATVFKDWKYTVLDGKATIVDTTQKARNVTIPSEIDGYPVVEIAAEAFAGCSAIERIVISSSVTNIDVSAFQGCTSLKYLEVDDGNTEFVVIDGLLCDKDITRVLFAIPTISTVIIPDSVTNIALNAFIGCTSLNYVELPRSLKSLVEEGDVFASCPEDINVIYAGDFEPVLNGEWHEVVEGMGDVDVVEDSTAEEGASVKFTANDSSSIWIETVVTNAGRVSFDWKISCEKFKDYKVDYFSFLIDGQEMVWDNGEVDWTNLVYEITGEGEHVLRWTYTKDESGKSGQDCAWLKDFSFTPLVTVAFSMGDADGGDLPESVTGYSGDTLVIPEDCVLRKAKHTFSGWTDGALNYVPGAVYTLSLTDLTLLPVWVAKIVEAPVIEVAGRYYTQKTTASISCQTEGARIYYTLDGTEPTAESNLYEGPFEVEGSAVIRALACKDDWFSSETAQASTERALWTSGECLNSAHLPFLTDSTAGWVRDMNITHDGQASMRSGTIGDSQESSINLTVNGPGEISFWWKVSSESYKNYQVDYLSFTVDGVERHWICGEVDWAKVSFVIEDDGAHELKWTYKKDAENSEGSDAAWLDEVVWRTEGFSPITYTNLRGATHSNPKMYQEGTLVSFTNPSGVTGYTFAGWIPSQITADMTGAQIVTAKWNWNPQDATVESSITGGKEVPVKAEWVTEELDRRFGLGKKELFIERFGDDFALALLKKTGKRDSAGNELCVWHDYVAGTDPTDADSVFRARIEMVDGKPVVSWDPDLNSDGEERVYLVHGKEHLMDSWHLPVTAIDRFFKVEVSMPFDNIVLFNVNGGSSIGAISIRIGQPLGILPEPTREGYTFLGWFTGLEDGGVVTPETIVTDDMTIYAHWTVNSYTVTFDANGGEGGTTLSRDYGLSLGSLPTPTREGYTFAGWWTAASGGTQITSSTIVTGNVIYYAHWQKLCEKVQLWEGGPYWATTNIGAENPEDCGYYFWWGDTVGYKRENDKWVASDGSNSDFSFESDNTPTYGKSISTLQSEGWITSDAVLAPSHDAATVHWGNGWRMPTKDEFDALRNNCDWTWTKQNGVNGYVVKGRGAYASKSIFLPAAGYGNGTSLYRSGSNGYYWSSVPSSDSYYAWDLYFDSSYHITSYSDRYDRQSVRPVLGFTK